MKTLHNFDDLRSLPCPVHWAMGFFDGVHRGHRRVIESASTEGALRGVLTFRPHPLSLLAPGRAPLLITPHYEHKQKLLRDLGTEVLLILPFTRELASTSPRDFLRNLTDSCTIAGISVGSNWHFGRGGSGNADFLRAWGNEHKFRTCISDMLSHGNHTICSSAIRELLRQGDISTANSMLGYNFTITGTVEHGQKLARQFGFPTANISLPISAACPRAGVYQVQATIDGKLRKGIANVGKRPTIDELYKPTRLEAHFFDWSGDLYGKQLFVELTDFIREERSFPDLDSLKSQIQCDMALAKS